MALFVHESFASLAGIPTIGCREWLPPEKDIHAPKILAKNRGKMGVEGVILGCPYSFVCPCPISLGQQHNAPELLYPAQAHVQ